jgi:hypothetical protein
MSSNNRNIDDEHMTKCSSPRPQICTREYKPVCGYQVDESYKTYSTGCEACSNLNVVSYIDKQCQ